MRVGGGRVKVPASGRLTISPQLLRRPRAAIVVTGSELVRGERTDLNGPVLRPGGAAPRPAARPHRDRRRRPGRARGGAAGGLRGGRLPRLGRARPDARRPHGRARRTRRREGSRARRGARAARSSRSRARFAERMRRPYADFAAGVRKQATLPDGAVSLGIAGTAPGVVLDTGSLRRRRAPGAAGRAAAALAAGARVGAAAARPRADDHARAARRCASTARASRPSPRRSPRPVVTATGSR